VTVGFSVNTELHGLLLAAGGSSRLGRPKQLVELHGEPLVRRAARFLGEVTDVTWVVTGARRAETELALEDLSARVEHNARWAEGMGTSLAFGVDKLPARAGAVLIMTCDQYRLDACQLADFVGAWRRQPARILAARWAQTFGPPVIFPRGFFTQLLRMSGDEGARRLLVQHRPNVRFHALPDAAWDLDDPADLAAFRLYAADTTQT